MPLSRRMPKRGFTNIFRKEIVKVDLAALNYFEDGSVVDANSLVQAGIIRSAKDGVKVLANGTLTKQLTVQCPASKKAAEEITAAGGKVEVI
jgi:large subunit ribosomal protein L15